jgi:hypothetical protein
MGERAEALARRYEGAFGEVVQAVERCPDDKWKESCPDTGWPANFQARHIAGGAMFFAGAFGKIARGEPYPAPPMSAIDAGNAQQLEAGRGVSKQEALAELRAGGPAMAGFIRGLSDEELDRTGQIVQELPAMTVEQLIERVAMGELANHGGALRRAVGG